MPDEIVYQNASKFATFLVKRTGNMSKRLWTETRQFGAKNSTQMSS